MSTFDNPFSIDRAEQLGDQLFKFFAHHKKLDNLLKRKSLMVQGGRGSGKTMFFLYHTYRTKKVESASLGEPFNEFINKIELLGIHFRCDSNFVPGFQNKGLSIDEWKEIFAHYMNLALSKQLLEIIVDINSLLENNKIDFLIQKEVKSLFHIKQVNDFEELYNLIKIEELKIIQYVNNVGRIEKPILITNGLLLNLISKSILEQKMLTGKSIHIFIDEYENLLEYQQVLINTLIKHPAPVIFNIGTRNEGVKTHRTLAEGESISAPHDYNYFNIEDFKKSDFEELINDVCQKRLRRISELSELPLDSEYLDIKYYLGAENLKDEIDRVFVDNKSKEYINLCTQYLERLSKYNKSELPDLYEVTDPLFMRLIIVLIDRGNGLKEIQIEYNKYKNNKASNFKDWLHNNSTGLIYLMCKENGKKKNYYGYNTYISLSSGIIRYFIELCEIAFRNASREGFNFSTPRPLNAKEQTDAALYVSKYKINDVETYTPFSRELKQFTLLLGGIFEKLHRNPKLSEPEQNHFSTDYERLSPSSKSFLSNAVLYSILQKRDETKDKSDAIDSNSWEYHLNHIYTPYFQISPKRKRRLDIPNHLFEALISGDLGKAEAAANNIIGGKDKAVGNNQLHLKDLF